MSRRPGSLAIWIVALVGIGVGVAIGAAQKQLDYQATLIAYVITAPIAAGLVRRGRDLRVLVFTLPLALVIALAVSAHIALTQTKMPATAKAIVTEVGKSQVLNPGWLWLGTALAVFVGLRRGMFHRAR